jgi:hypothetical protein
MTLGQGQRGRCVYASKKNRAFAQDSFLRSFFSGRQTFAARTSQNAAPTL